jgi:hypothetical protein
MASARATIEKTTLEGIQFAADGMAVYHKIVGMNYRKFLQTGDKADLGDAKDVSFRTYQGMVDLFMKMTGQGKENRQEVVFKTDAPISVSMPELPSLPKDRPATSDEAYNLLLGLDSKGKP